MSKVTSVKSFYVKPVTATTSATLTKNDSNKTYFLNAASGFTLTLPSPMGGVSFEFIVKTAPTSGDYVIAATDTIILGQVFTSDLNTSLTPDSETSGVQNTKFKANIARIGDSIEVTSDGTNWFVKGFSAVVDAIVLE